MILRCHGCGWTAPTDEPLAFRCANAADRGSAQGDGTADDIDHVLTIVDTTTTTTGPDTGGTSIDTGDANPFIRYRHRLYSHDFALRHGLSDERYVDLVRALDDAVAAVDGRGFRITPFAAQLALSERLGVPILVKDETGNVSGSHKARHLMGIMVHLLVAERVAELVTEASEGAAARGRPRLAIASCGNAALAAAVVARAASWPLEVFVPPGADIHVVERLRDLGATITRCPRLDADPPGDPCVHRFREAVAAGAIPFGCQGPDNGLAIDGGRTLGWELADQAAALPFGRICIQVGGGALASSVVQALRADGSLPVVHPVQTEGCAPLARAWQRSQEVLGATHARAHGSLDDALEALARQRSRVMWPWESEPRSAATGILDDETYDWWEILAATHHSGGQPVVAREADIVEALRLARTLTPVPVDATGSAGLAGLLRLLDEHPGVREEQLPVAVIFTGRDRTVA